MMKIKRLASLGVLAGAFLGAAPAWAANCAAITVATSPPTIAFDPIKATGPVTATFTITVGAKVSNPDVSAILIFTDSVAATPLKIGAAGPQYTITNSGAQLVSFQSGTTAAIQSTITKIPVSNASSNVTYTVSLPVNTTVDYTGGTSFTENLSYSLQCYKSLGTTATGSDTGSLLNLTSTITNVLSVITASPQTLNFGNFTTTSQNLQVNIKSTNTINVAVSTANSSVMALAGAVAPYAANNSIPYTMTFNGAALASTATNNVVRASVTGANYPFALNLTGGLPTGKLAGTYSDVITLTITPGA